MRVLKRSLALVAFGLVVLVAGSCARDEATGIPPMSASGSGASSALNDVIVFGTEEFGVPTQLAVMHPDGSGRRRVTNDDRGYINPAIAPDGRRIAASRFTNDNTFEGLYLMNADGSDPTLLVHRSFFDGQAAWSPDGARIAFQSFDEGPFGALAKIFVINVDGTGLRQLSPPIDEQNEWFFDEGPTWSPDGGRIAFTRNSQLYLINADGSGFTLVQNEDGAFNASWSPDGTRIAYQSMNPWGDVHVRNVDGSNLVAVTANTAQEGEPKWSPDGRRLVFERVLGGRFQFFVINADGTGETRLSFGPADYNPAWSPFPGGRSDAGISIEISPTDAKLAPSDTREFTATVRTTSGTVVDRAVTWSSSDPAVATVTSTGLVTAIDNGVTQIQAAFGNATAGAQVRVVDRVLRNVIVYSTDEFVLPDFAVVKPDGTGRRRLTTDNFGYQSPDISPDGRRIAFATFFSIFIINADAAGITEGFTQLFSSFEFGALPGTPAWSPDGSLVAFSAVQEGPFGPARRIHVANADGSGGLRQVTPDDADAGSITSDDAPTWSPDGTQLIFTRNGVLHVINADGTGITPLPNEDLSASPDWSPDGTRVAYASPAPGFGIRIRNADGSNPVTVTTVAGDSHPRWAPDNQRLVFVRVVDGRSQLYVVNANGTGEARLSTGTGQHTDPSWSPVP